jgi:hypothetical protein
MLKIRIFLNISTDSIFSFRNVLLLWKKIKKSKDFNITMNIVIGVWSCQGYDRIPFRGGWASRALAIYEAESYRLISATDFILHNLSCLISAVVGLFLSFFLSFFLHEPSAVQILGCCNTPELAKKERTQSTKLYFLHITIQSIPKTSDLHRRVFQNTKFLSKKSLSEKVREKESLRRSARERVRLSAKQSERKKVCIERERERERERENIGIPFS